MVYLINQVIVYANNVANLTFPMLADIQISFSPLFSPSSTRGPDIYLIISFWSPSLSHKNLLLRLYHNDIHNFSQLILRQGVEHWPVLLQRFSHLIGSPPLCFWLPSLQHSTDSFLTIALRSFRTPRRIKNLSCNQSERLRFQICPVKSLPLNSVPSPKVAFLMMRCLTFLPAWSPRTSWQEENSPREVIISSKLPQTQDINFFSQRTYL